MSGAAERRPIVVLISGRGSNMRALIDASGAPGSTYAVAAVLADQAGAPGLAAARNLGVEAQALAADGAGDRLAYDRRLAAAVARYSPTLVVLAGFMRILSAPFVAAYTGRILNIHPSLLPKYPGLHTHRRVLAARDGAHGATVHFVTSDLDAGPAVIQGRIEVAAGDDETRLGARVRAVEHRILPLAVGWFCGGRLACRDGKAWFDGKALDSPLLLPAVVSA
ncbi:MAG TPA: phosphoribosylglycinamide formyltransferase [Steroidobacteraceae bacterium]|nr:phosphoribosylglycinamide formyltransferase [Steroidobacteraceae bacterium]